MMMRSVNLARQSLRLCATRSNLLAVNAATTASSDYRFELVAVCKLAAHRSVTAALVGQSKPMAGRPLTMLFNRRYGDDAGDHAADSATSFHVQDYDDFRERVLNAGTPVVVDFYADWCGPCRMLAPRLESLVDRRGGDVQLAKVNIDELQDLALDYDVQSVPYVLAFKDGEVVDKFVGAQEDQVIQNLLDKLSE